MVEQYSQDRWAVSHSCCKILLTLKSYRVLLRAFPKMEYSMKRKYYSTRVTSPFEYGFRVPQRFGSGEMGFWDDMQPWNNSHNRSGLNWHVLPQSRPSIFYDDFDDFGDVDDYSSQGDTSLYYPVYNSVVGRGAGWGVQPTSHGGPYGGRPVKTIYYVNGVRVGDSTNMLPGEYPDDFSNLINGGTPAPIGHVPSRTVNSIPEFYPGTTSSGDSPSSEGHTPQDTHIADETPFFRPTPQSLGHLKYGSHQYDVTPQRMQEYGMKVTIYQHGSPFSHHEAQYAKEMLEKTIKVYEEYFGKYVPRDVPKEISIHTFDDVGQYFSSLGSAGFHVGHSTTGFIEAARGVMWISPASYSPTHKFGSLPHELGHLLFQSATGGFFAYADDSILKGAITTLNDGFCEFISAKVYGDGDVKFAQVARSALGYFASRKGHGDQVLSEMGTNHAYNQCGPIDCNTLQYQAGHVLARFLVEQSPGTLQNVFKQAAQLARNAQYVSRSTSTSNANNILQGINKHGMGEVESWLRGKTNPRGGTNSPFGMPTYFDDEDQYYSDDYYDPRPAVRKPVSFTVKSPTHVPQNATTTESESNFIKDKLGRIIEVKHIDVSPYNDQSDSARIASVSKPAVSKPATETVATTSSKPAVSTPKVVTTTPTTLVVKELAPAPSIATQNTVASKPATETATTTASSPAVITPKVVAAPTVAPAVKDTAPVANVETQNTVASKPVTETVATTSSSPVSNTTQVVASKTTPERIYSDYKVTYHRIETDSSGCTIEVKHIDVSPYNDQSDSARIASVSKPAVSKPATETVATTSSKPAVSTPKVVTTTPTTLVVKELAPAPSIATQNTVASKPATETATTTASSPAVITPKVVAAPTVAPAVKDTAPVASVETQNTVANKPVTETAATTSSSPAVNMPNVVATTPTTPVVQELMPAPSVETQSTVASKPAIATTNMPEHSVSIASAPRDVHPVRDVNTNRVNHVETQDLATEKARFEEPSSSVHRVKHGIAYDVTPQSMSAYGMKVTIYKQGSPLSQDLITSAQDLIERTMQVYESHFGKFVPQAIPREVSILMFDYDHEYLRSIKTLFPSRGDNTSGLSSASDGLVWVSPSSVRGAGEKNFGTMVHEFGHILYRSATGGFLDGNNSLNAYHQSKALGEGFSEFLNGEVHKNDFSHTAKQADSYLKGKYQHAPVLTTMGTDIEHGRCGSQGCGTVKYQTGHTLVKFLEESAPGLLRNVFKAAADNSAKYASTGIRYDAAKFFQPINKYSIADVATWASKLKTPGYQQTSSTFHDVQDYYPVQEWGTYNTLSRRGRWHKVRRDTGEEQELSVDEMPVSTAAAQSRSEDSQLVEQAASAPTQRAIVATAPRDASKPAEKETAHTPSDVVETATTGSTVLAPSVEQEVARIADNAKSTVVEPEISAEVASSHDTRKSFSDVEAQFTVSTDVYAKLLERCNIKLVVHSTQQLSEKAVARIKKIMVKTLKAYQKEFGNLPQSDAVRKIDIFLFKNGSELKDALREIGEPNWDSAAGINWSSLGKIYVSKLGKVKIENLAHEMTHQLMYYSTGHAFDKIPGMAILCEGVADYIQYLVAHSKKNGMTIEFSSGIDGVRKMFNENPELKNATSLEQIYKVMERNADNPDYAGLKYSFGRVFVHYLQKVHPDALKTLFVAGHEKSAKGEYYDQLANIVNNIPASFSEWLSENALEKHISKHEMLTVSEADGLGFCDTIINSKVVRANVYAANLEDSNHGHVGKLSPVAHFVHNGSIRAYNPYSGDSILLGKEFSYIKLVSTAEGQRYSYCDANGQEFTNALSWANVDQIAKILSKYSPSFSVIRAAVTKLDQAFAAFGDEHDTAARSAVIAAMSNLKSILGSAARNIYDEEFRHLLNTDLAQQNPSMSNIAGDVRNVRAAYSRFVSTETHTLLHSPERSAFEQAMMLNKILKAIVFIDPEAIISSSDSTFDHVAQQYPGRVLQVVGLGKGDKSGASVFLDGKKLGELPSNAEGFVKYTDPAGKEVSTFITMDALKAVHTSYSGSPLIVVTKDAQGNKVANFWSGTKSGTLSDQEIEVEVNQFLDLAAKGIKARESFPLSKDLKIAVYNNDAVVDEETPAIVPGAKLDDRGTERESDDLYSAQLKVGNNVLIQKMSSLQFYMTEERTDESGNIIEKPDFFIRDVAADRIIQFPESITHLKLVRTAKGTIRLVPCTKDGDTNPQGMPENMEQYSYIDPIFAYDRKSSEWVATNSKFSLVDFSGYPAGTLFKLSQDRDDPAIKRDANGNVLRVGNQPFNVSVNLDGPNGERVGRLASTTTFFQDKVFLAMDHSYSQSDFVSSMHMQEAEVQDTSAIDVKRVALSGENDLGTDRGFSEYYSQYQRTKEDDPNLRKEIGELASGSQSVASASEDQQATASASSSQANNSGAHEASESESSTLTHTFAFMFTTADPVTGEQLLCLNWFDRSTGVHKQFPREITHVKVVTHEGQKYLVPCTANGNEAPEGMPDQGRVYINPLLVHTAVSRYSTEDGNKVQLKLLNLSSYDDGTLFSIKVGGQLSYAALGYEDKMGDPVRVPHLYDSNGTEVAMLSTYGTRIKDKIVIEEDTSSSAQTAGGLNLVQSLGSTEGHNVGSEDGTIDTTHFAAKSAKSNEHDYISQVQQLPSSNVSDGHSITDVQRYDSSSVSDVHNASKEHDHYNSNHQHGYGDSDFSIL